MFTQVTERLWEIETRDLPMTASSHLALFRLVGLSKRNIIEPSLTAFTGFPFAHVNVQSAKSAFPPQKKHKVHLVPSGLSN